jgi:hypothetical protein
LRVGRAPGTVRRVPRIGYFPVEDLVDPELRSAVRDAARHGSPRPESQAVRAHAPEVLRAFTRAWNRTFRHGVCDPEIKELCRRHVEDGADFDAELDRFDDRERAALAYAHAITHDPGEATDALWARLHRHFTDEQLVELGWFVAMAHGQKRWLQTVRCGRGEVLSLNRAAAVV